MPTEARWLIRTALLYLVLALALGIVRAGQAAGLVPGESATLWLPQLHFFTVGWITQLIFGVAFWLFPRPRQDSKQTPAWLIWGAYGTLNGGLLVRGIVEPGWTSGAIESWGLGLSAGLQWGASLFFAVHFWSRVRSK